MTFKHDVARVYAPLLQPHRYKGARGGRGSAKSHFFSTLLLKRSLEQATRSVCIREVQKSLEQSVKRLLEDKINEYHLGHMFRVMNTHIVAPHGGVIIFNGMQAHTAESIKSLEGYDLAWVEEAQSLSERSLTLLRPTIRKPGSEIWCSWNPRFATDPIERFFCGATPPPDSVLVRSTFNDNPWFPAVLRAEMEWDRGRDSDKYAHVWMGEYEKHSESRVFKNWRVEEFETPADTMFRYGGDWGFSVDPAVLIRTWLKPPKTLFIDRELYRIGVEIDDLPRFFDGIACGCDYSLPHVCRYTSQHGAARAWEIVADSARPETISYLQRHGYPKIVPSVKGPNSVKEGVIFLQGYNIVIHPRCKHTIDEFSLYSYKRDPLTDAVTPILQDTKNHVIDSTRYATEKLRAPVKEPEWATW